MNKERHIIPIAETLPIADISQAELDEKIRKWGVSSQTFESLPHLAVVYLPHDLCTSHDQEACIMLGKLYACKYKVTRFNGDKFEAIYFNSHDGNFYERIFVAKDWCVEGNILTKANSVVFEVVEKASNSVKKAVGIVNLVPLNKTE